MFLACGTLGSWEAVPSVRKKEKGKLYTKWMDLGERKVGLQTRR